MKVLILCLRRSGSTEFWKMFRQDKRFICYDEPFNPMLCELPREFLKKTNNEFINLYNKNADEFNDKFYPVDCEGECTALKEREVSYLNYLFEQNEHVVIDVTRLNFKAEELLQKISKDVFIIHLYRSPIAFASSHILANRPELKPFKFKYIKSRIKYYFNKLFFFKAWVKFNDWGYESVVNNLEFNNDHKPYEKLLLIWKKSYCEIEDAAKKRGNIISLSFEDFVSDPEGNIKNIYKLNGLEYKTLDYSSIRATNKGFAINSNKWKKAFQKIGLPGAIR